MTKSLSPWVILFAIAIAVRVLTLGAYPLLDTTEARYGEVARLMVTSGDWITPQIEAGVPFWGKPPLSFWLTASSFAVFGVNEFAARLPSVVLFLLTCLIVYRLARPFGSGALAACGIMLTSGVGFISAGAVMTDAALLLSVTLSLAAFWETACRPESRWRYLFFVGAGLGLLAKGPISLILIGLPIAVWTLVYRNPIWLLKQIPWVTGTMITVIIAVPWYLAAEAKTPGFLEYFIVGEHWLRFLDSGWSGDLYGRAHSEPRGTIWLFALLGALPWSVPAVVLFIRWLREGDVFARVKPFQAFLALWMLTPLAFFTLAANILPAYALPGLPAFALLLGCTRLPENLALPKLGYAIPAAVVIAILAMNFGWLQTKTQQDLVAHHAANAEGPLYYFPKIPFSANYYSRGTVRSLETIDDVISSISDDPTIELAMRESAYTELRRYVGLCWKPTASFNRYVLVEMSQLCEHH